MSKTMTTPPRPRVLVVCAGFAGLSVVRGLRRAALDITVIDRRNFHLFQPLLYQVATAGLTPSDIAWPIRSILRDQPNVEVVLGEVVSVDPAVRTLSLQSGKRYDYDWLVLATGATHNYFGNAHWRASAPGLKRVDDATSIRRRILMAFERAELCDDAQERARLMTFVIIGAGPTGVEMAGAIAELASHALARDFRRIDPRQARIVLLEGGPRVLASFSEGLSAYACRALERLGVEVRVGARVSDCDATGVIVNGQPLAAATLIWAAGVAASPAAEWLSTEGDRAGRVQVRNDLRLSAYPEVFVIGDTAAMPDGSGGFAPGIAPAAKQAGAHVARVIAAAVAGKSPPGPFRYRHYGNLATIGRHEAVIDFGRVRLCGSLAWWVWGIAHVVFLIGMRHRLLVAAQWFFSYLTFGRGARLIAGRDDPPTPAAPTVPGDRPGDA